MYKALEGEKWEENLKMGLSPGGWGQLKKCREDWIKVLKSKLLTQYIMTKLDLK